MSESYYSVEKISQMLGIHPKTVQRYIREGKLRATKIGKSWRVTGHDLSVFTEGEKLPIGGTMEKQENSEKNVTVSSVIDIKVIDKEEAVRIINMLSAAMNIKPPEYGPSTLRTMYLETEDTVRIMIWGSLKFTSVILQSLEAVTENQ